MEPHRFFVAFLLVVGLFGVYARNYDEDLSQELADWQRLDDTASAVNPANEDYSSHEDVDGGRLRKRSNPSTAKMSKEDFEWHIKEGEEVMKTLSEETRKEKENRNWVKKELEARRKNAETAATMKALNEQRRKAIIILEEGSPERKKSRPAPSRLT